MNHKPRQATAKPSKDTAIERLGALLGDSRQTYLQLHYNGSVPRPRRQLPSLWRRLLWHPAPLAASAVLLIVLMIGNDTRPEAGFTMPSRPTPVILPALSDRTLRIMLPTAPSDGLAMRFRLPKRPRPTVNPV